jgi:phage terminase large subunit-like protein
VAPKVKRSTAQNFEAKQYNEGDEIKPVVPPIPLVSPEAPNVKITPELFQELSSKPVDDLTDDEAKLLFWIHENIVKKERPMLFYQPNETAKAFHACQSPYRLLVGGNRSGKTFSGSAEAVYFATCTHPYKKDLEPNEGWVVSETYKVQEEASQKLIMEKLPPNQISKIVLLKGGVYESIFVDVIKGGRKVGTSKIGFKSSDSGMRNFAGAAKRWIWFDEEPPRDIYSECLARIAAGHPLDIFFTMTPIFQQRGQQGKGGMSWVYRELYMKRDGKRISSFSMSVEDNLFLNEEQVAEQKLKYTGVEYDIRIKGEFKLLSGNSVFDVEKLEARMKDLPKFAQGYLDYAGTNYAIKFHDKSNGVLKVWAEPHPNRRYFIGADIGLGVGGDPSCACVLDDQLNQVAELHGQLAPDQMGDKILTLAKWYNQAWVGIEANSFGIAAIDAVKKLYGKLYFSYKIDGRTDQRTRRIGWWTDTKTKPLMIGEFAKAVREESITLNSRELMEEMGTYVLGDDGSVNAEKGCNDDRVIAAMIAMQVRKKHLVSASDTPLENYRPANSSTGY